eukprot:scaffold112510_cov32-Phaeocystis_antarctica.AAC.1
MGDSTRAVCPRRRCTRVDGCDMAPACRKLAEALRSGHGERLRRRKQPQQATLASDEITIWGQLPALGVARLAELKLH